VLNTYFLKNVYNGYYAYGTIKTWRDYKTRFFSVILHIYCTFKFNISNKIYVSSLSGYSATVKIRKRSGPKTILYIEKII